MPYSYRVLQIPNALNNNSFIDIFTVFAKGATLLLLEDESMLNIELLIEEIEQNDVSIIMISEKRLEGLLSENTSRLNSKIRAIILTEGVITKNSYISISQLFENTRIYAQLRSISTGLIYAIREIESSEELLLTKSPKDHLELSILDKNRRSVPLGAVGEIYVGGYGINTFKTRDNKFIDVFNTNYIGKTLSDGSIVYFGRQSDIVNFNGYYYNMFMIQREIEEAFWEIDAKVFFSNNEEQLEIICTYNFDSNSDANALLFLSLKSRFKELIPSVFCEVEFLQLLKSEDVDFASLKDIMNTQKTNQNLTETEKKLLEFVGILLDKNISIKNNFFEVGGNSFKAIQLGGLIFSKFGIDVGIQDIMKSPIIKDIASQIDSSNKSLSKPMITKLNDGEYHKVSYVQKLRINSSGTSQNMPQILRIKGEICKEKLKIAVNLLVERHESLRTSFHEIDGEHYQKVHKSIDYNIEELRTVDNQIDELVTSLIIPFDTSNPGLFRIKLIYVADKIQYVFIDMHHIISDGYSTNIFYGDLIKLYSGLTLPKIEYHYKDYVNWLIENHDENSDLQNNEYWEKKLKNVSTSLSIPNDKVGPNEHISNGAYCSSLIVNTEYCSIKDYIHNSDVTLYTYFYSLLSVFLKKYSTGDDVVLRSGTSDRKFTELHKTIGLFIYPILLVNDVGNNFKFSDLLKRSKEDVMDAFKHKLFDINKYVKSINEETLQKINVDVAYVVQNFDRIKFEMDEFECEPIDFSEGAIMGFIEELKELSSKVVLNDQLLIRDLINL